MSQNLNLTLNTVSEQRIKLDCISDPVYWAEVAWCRLTCKNTWNYVVYVLKKLKCTYFAKKNHLVRTDRVQDLLGKHCLTEVTLLGSGKSFFFWGTVANIFKLISMLQLKIKDMIYTVPVADPGFLERGFIFIKVWEVRFAD